MNNNVKMKFLVFSVGLNVLVALTGCSSVNSLLSGEEAPDSKFNIVDSRTGLSYTCEDYQKCSEKYGMAVVVEPSRPQNPGFCVGLKEGSPREWCKTNADAYNVNILGLQTMKQSMYGMMNLVWGVDKNNKCDAGDPDKLKANYPAWYFADVEYGQTYLKGSKYGEKWNIPTLSELRQIYNNKDSINNSIRVAGGDPLGDKVYWTCTQDSGNAKNALGIDFSNGNVVSCDKASLRYVRVVSSW